MKNNIEMNNFKIKEFKESKVQQSKTLQLIALYQDLQTESLNPVKLHKPMTVVGILDGSEQVERRIVQSEVHKYRSRASIDPRTVEQSVQHSYICTND